MVDENVQIGNLEEVQVDDMESATCLPTHTQATTCEADLCRGEVW